jgi:hypothetical protein
MKHEEAARLLKAAAEELGYVEVWDTMSSPNNVSLFCRIPETSTPAWGKIAQKILRDEQRINRQSGRPVVQYMICRRYMLKNDRFGYTWQITVWASDLTLALEIFPGGVTQLATVGKVRRPRRRQEELEEYSLPRRSKKRNQPGLKMVPGVDGQPRPSTRGAQGKPP